MRFVKGCVAGALFVWLLCSAASYLVDAVVGMTYVLGLR